MPAKPGIDIDSEVTPADDESLVELLDRLLHAGVVLSGDVIISVADVELVYLRLQLVLSSIETAREVGWYRPGQAVAPISSDPPSSSQARARGNAHE